MMKKSPESSRKYGRKWKKLLGRIRLIATIVILLGVGIYLLLVYETAKSIEITDKRIESIYPKSATQYEVRFFLTLKNPKNFDIEIDYINYRVYVENEFVGRGIKPHFFIKNGVHKYEFNFTFSINNLSNAVKNLLLLNEANIKIKGEIMIPAKFMGIFTWKHIKVPYEVNKKLS